MQKAVKLPQSIQFLNSQSKWIGDLNLTRGKNPLKSRFRVIKTMAISHEENQQMFNSSTKFSPNQNRYSRNVND